MLLDELMPGYEFDDGHGILGHAPPERALEEIKQASPGEMPLVRLLFAIRSLPAYVSGKSGLPTGKTESLYEQMLDFGFVLLAQEPNREVVCGGIGQMFKLRGGDAPAIRDAREFVAFEEPGYAKVVMNFSLEAVGSGARLTTETRILTTDGASRRRFARYWRVVRPGSAAIRRSWLRAAKRRVERGAEVRRHAPPWDRPRRV